MILACHYVITFKALQVNTYILFIFFMQLEAFEIGHKKCPIDFGVIPFQGFTPTEFGSKGPNFENQNFLKDKYEN